MNQPEEQIPQSLAQETVRVGSLELWQYQAFVHHDHPVIGHEDGGIEMEVEVAKFWAETLESRFPEMRFVVEVAPLEQITWYQVTRSSPTSDHEVFEEYTASFRFKIPRASATSDTENLAELVEKAYEMAKEQSGRTGALGRCERCGALDNFSSVSESPIHRGIRLIQCLSCGSDLVHSTRTIRNLVGPKDSLPPVRKGG